MDSRARILFVEDHAVLLNALRMGMRPDQKRWDMEFAGNTEQALEVLSQRHFDVIVSDLEMPGTPGWGLLATVKEKSPDTARIVMSGLSDHATLEKVAPYMHRYLQKPCAIRELRDSIAQVFALKQDVPGNVLQSIVGGADLPTAPQVYLSLRAAAANPTSSLEEIAEIVQRDAGLAAKVLQLANSAYFSRSGPAIDIDAAVFRLGLELTQSLALSAYVFSLGSDDAQVPVRFRVSALQRSAVLSATLARMLAPQGRDIAFVAALLRHVGTLALQGKNRSKLQAVAAAIELGGQSPADAEREALGVGFNQLGAYILGMWGLPAAVVDGVARQRTPPVSSPVDDAGAVYVATSMVDERLDDRLVLNMEAIERVGLLKQVPRWTSLLDEVVAREDERA